MVNVYFILLLFLYSVRIVDKQSIWNGQQLLLKYSMILSDEWLCITEISFRQLAHFTTYLILWAKKSAISLRYFSILLSGTPLLWHPRLRCYIPLYLSDICDKIRVRITYTWNVVHKRNLKKKKNRRRRKRWK